MFLRFWRRPITGDLIFLYLAFVANYVFPLVTIPFLARKLGLAGWGNLIFVQSFCQLVLVLLSFGLSLHGTRMVARLRDDRILVSQIHSEITIARLFLILPALAVVAAAFFAIPSLHQYPLLASLGFVYALATAFSPGWLLQGLDKMRLYSSMETLTKFLSSAAIFVFIKDTKDAYLVLAFQAASSVVVTALSYGAIWHSYPIRFINVPSVFPIYRKCAALFIFSLSGALISQTNAFLLGIFTSPQAVGIFSGGDKIVRSLCALVGPFSTAIHAKINYRLGKDPASASALFLRSTGFLLIAGILVSLLLAVGSEWLVRLALGRSFGESGRIVRILCLLPITNWLSYNINLNWMIALHLDALVTKCVFFAALINVIGACILCPFFAEIGMAWSAVASEFALLSSLLAAMYLRPDNPFRFGTVTPSLANSASK